MSKSSQTHPTERADLHGKRLVAAIETEDGKRLAESLVKEITGGDDIRARRMREDFWQFTASHTIFLATNHKPVIHGTDNGIWRRVRLIEFSQTIPESEQDIHLKSKLCGELPGILNWALIGCLRWQNEGLSTPECVSAATAEYRAESDAIGRFIDERCSVDAKFQVNATKLYESYKSWCEHSGEVPVSMTDFGKRVGKKFQRKKSGVYNYHGLTLNG